jgi:N-acylneuraminate cytidylyltransferase
VYFRSPEGYLRISTGEASPIPRRQSLPDAYCRDGAVYVTRTAVVLRGSLYGEKVAGHVSEEEDAVNLDESSDWERAETIAASRRTAAR